MKIKNQGDALLPSAFLLRPILITWESQSSVVRALTAGPMPIHFCGFLASEIPIGNSFYLHKIHETQTSLSPGSVWVLSQIQSNSGLSPVGSDRQVPKCNLETEERPEPVRPKEWELQTSVPRNGDC